MSKRPADGAPIDLTGDDDKPAADGAVGGRRVRRRVSCLTTVRPGRAGAGSDDDKGSDYAQSGSDEDDDDDDDDEAEVSDYEEDDRDEVAEAKKGGAKAAPARARKAARNPAAGKKGGAEKKTAKVASGRPAPPPPRRRRQLGEEELPDDYDDLEEELEDMPEGFSSFASDFGGYDFSHLVLKPDHANRPLWLCPDGRIFLESFSPIYKAAYDFLIAVAEPVCRPESMHEYALTPHSLYAAVSVGLETSTILSVLNRLSKTQLPTEIEDFVRVSTQNYGKVKLVLQKNRFFLESAYPDVLRKLLKDDVISKARIVDETPATGGGAGEAAFSVSRAPVEEAAAALAAAADIDGGAGSAGGGATTAATGDGRELHSFEIDPAQVEHVKQRCLPGELNYPTLEEYDFRADTVNPDVPGLELKPATQVRPYQDKSLSKMFGNGRARSGIIVLPCGAGKSLTGIAAAARIRKSVLCLCTSSVSVDQWRYQFKLWTQLPDASVVRFTSQMKEALPEGQPGVVVSTYNMIAFNGRRSEESERILASIRSREWGLMLLDEVHVVPAAMFRKVVGITKAHAKLGLTATLVREDDRIDHLNFLIGPKLYEANWLDLQRGGFIANVQCAEVWCPMTKEFYAEYLKPENSARRQALYVMNPTKFRTCQYLMQYHEQTRGDKIIVFSDNLFALREYAARMRRPFVYGGTNHAERTRVLHAFKHSNTVNTIFLSKVGDNSIDIPEANVIIQISSHAGSRRQEAQRLGRILRPKARPPGAGPPAPDDYNAFFYSLVSTDTVEMYYSTKRQQFLVDQGYSFKVVTNLFSEEDGRSLMLSRHDEQLAMLAAVMAAGEDEAGEERLPEDADELREKDSALVPRRAVRNMAQVSGAGNMAYMEYRTGAGGAPRAAPRPSGPPRAHHSLLRDRFAKR